MSSRKISNSFFKDDAHLTPSVKQCSSEEINQMSPTCTCSVSKEKYNKDTSENMLPMRSTDSTDKPMRRQANASRYDTPLKGYSLQINSNMWERSFKMFEREPSVEKNTLPTLFNSLGTLVSPKERISCTSQTFQRKTILVNHFMDVKKTTNGDSHLDACESLKTSHSVENEASPIVCHNPEKNEHLPIFSSPFHSSLIFKKRASLVPSSIVLQKFYFIQVSEPHILRDILYPLQGIDGTYIKYHPTYRGFFLRQDVVVSAPIRLLVYRCCQIGVYYNQLNEYLDPGHQSHASQTISHSMPYMSPTNPSSLVSSYISQKKEFPGHSACGYTATHGVSRRPVSSLIHQALHDFFATQCFSYYKFLALVENEVISTSQEKDWESSVKSFSLRRLFLWLQKPTEKMALCAALAQSLMNLKGGPLLSVVYDYSLCGDSEKGLLLTNMLNQITIPWLDMVYQWVTHGVLMDPYKEFFISSSVHEGSFAYTSFHSGSASTHDSEGWASEPLQFWISGYELHMSNVPIFLSSQIAQNILLCGKAVALKNYFLLLESYHQNHSLGADSSSSSSQVVDVQSSALCLQDVTCSKPPNQILNTSVNMRPSNYQKRLAMLQYLTGQSISSSIILFDPLEISRNTKSSNPSNNKSIISHKPSTEVTGSFRSLPEMEQGVHFLLSRNSEAVLHLLLYRYNFLQHCEAIRRLMLSASCYSQFVVRFLFLGQGDFVVELFMLLSTSRTLALTDCSHSTNTLQSHLLNPIYSMKGCDLTQPSAKISHHYLRCCLENAVASSNFHRIHKGFVGKFEISKLRDPPNPSKITGWEVVTLHYNVSKTPIALILDTESMCRYRQIHSLLWRTHHVSSVLNLLWLNHIRGVRRRTPAFSSSVARYNSQSSSTYESLNLDVQWAISKCQGLYSETSRFLSNLQAFFIYGVIEPCWFKFVEGLHSIVEKKKHPKASECLIDQILQCHSTYLNSMLTGLFLHYVQGIHIEGETPCSRPLERMTTFHLLSNSPHDDPLQNSPGPECAHSSKNTTLELILHLLQYIMSFVTLANTIFLSLHNPQSMPLDSTQLDSLDLIAHGFRTTLVEFLKHLNTIEKLNDSSSIDKDQASSGGVEFLHQNAIRVLLCRLDFNNFYGSDWELYRHYPANESRVNFSSIQDVKSSKHQSKCTLTENLKIRESTLRTVLPKDYSTLADAPSVKNKKGEKPIPSSSFDQQTNTKQTLPPPLMKESSLKQNNKNEFWNKKFNITESNLLSNNGRLIDEHLPPSCDINHHFNSNSEEYYTSSRSSIDSHRSNLQDTMSKSHETLSISNDSTSFCANHKDIYNHLSFNDVLTDGETNHDTDSSWIDSDNSLSRFCH